MGAPTPTEDGHDATSVDASGCWMATRSTQSAIATGPNVRRSISDTCWKECGNGTRERCLANAIDDSKLTRVYSEDETGTRLGRRAIVIIKTSHKEEENKRTHQ